MSEGERSGEGGINDLWNRLREYRDHAKDLEGEIRAERRVGEERHQQATLATADIKGELLGLHSLVRDQGATLTQIADGQRSILQTMASDRDTRIETAAALEAADKQRRQAADAPWSMSTKVIGLTLSVSGVLAVIATQLK